MNKTQLVELVAKKTNQPKSKVNEAADAIFSSIQTAIKKGQRVQLVGFGSWQKKKRKAREGRNPQTGKSIKIPAKNVVKFHTSKSMLDLLN